MKRRITQQQLAIVREKVDLLRRVLEESQGCELLERIGACDRLSKRGDDLFKSWKIQVSIADGTRSPV